MESDTVRAMKNVRRRLRNKYLKSSGKLLLMKLLKGIMKSDHLSLNFIIIFSIDSAIVGAFVN